MWKGPAGLTSFKSKLWFCWSPWTGPCGLGFRPRETWAAVPSCGPTSARDTEWLWKEVTRCHEPPVKESIVVLWNSHCGEKTAGFRNHTDQSLLPGSIPSPFSRGLCVCLWNTGFEYYAGMRGLTHASEIHGTNCTAHKEHQLLAWPSSFFSSRELWKNYQALKIMYENLHPVGRHPKFNF